MASFKVIQDRVERRVIDLPADLLTEIPLLINDAIGEAEARHDFKAQEAEFAATTAESVRKLADVPARWRKPRKVPYLRQGEDGLTGTARIKWASSLDEMLKRFALDDTTDDGEPQYVLLEVGGTELWTFPFPDAASEWDDGDHRVVVPYWRSLADLSADGDTNWFTDNAEDYLIMRATSEAFMLNWDEERGTFWLGKATQQFKIIRRLDALLRYGTGGTLAISADAAGPSPPGEA